MQQFSESVPVDLVHSSSGAAIDFGSSVTKFVYRTKEDFENAKSCGNKLGRLHLISIPTTDFTKCLEYVQQHVYLLNNNGEIPTILITGVGSAQFHRVICDTLNVKIDVVHEFDCFGYSLLHFSSRMSRRQLLHPFIVDAVDEAVEAITGTLVFASTRMPPDVRVRYVDEMEKKFRSGIGRHPADIILDTVVEDMPLGESEPDMLPCLLVVSGSCPIFFKVDKDRTFTFVGCSEAGGRSMVGISKFIAGCETLDVFIELASKGNRYAVDQTYCEAAGPTSHSANEVYDGLKDKSRTLAFNFGKAVNADPASFKREDLARAWLDYIVAQLAHDVHWMCSVYGIRRVFFAGGMIAIPEVRRTLTTEMTRRNLQQILFCQLEPITFDFLKLAHHMAALGCLVEDVRKSATVEIHNINV